MLALVDGVQCLLVVVGEDGDGAVQLLSELFEGEAEILFLSLLH